MGVAPQILNETDITPVEFAFIDDRTLIAQCGSEIVLKNVSMGAALRVEYILQDLINVVDCLGDPREVEPAVVIIHDQNGEPLKNFKFACRRLDISLNLFGRGYSITLQTKTETKKMPLSWALYRQNIIPDDAIFH